ncbi:hypothetical protein KKA17_04080 [bacterium]|nr:hypothetical protein [bacterium]
MEILLSILPFIVLFLIGRSIYVKYKELKERKKIQKPVSVFEKYQWSRYIKLVFGTRVWYRQSTAIWYVPFGFAFAFGGASLFVNLGSLVYPPLPLEKMQTKDGVIKSIVLRKKIDDLLILSTKDGIDEKFAIRNASAQEAKSLLNKEAKVWYHRGWSSGFTIDNIIYEITLDGKSIRKYPYDYERYLETNMLSWNFTKYCFYIVLFSALMIWIPNRKELPIHRLNRIKFNKQRREQENVE